MERPLLVRLAIVDMTDHEDVGRIPFAKDTIPDPQAKRMSEIRWYPRCCVGIFIDRLYKRDASACVSMKHMQTPMGCANCDL